MINLKKIIDSYATIFIDVDNTLFNYSYAHEKALESVCAKFSFTKEDYKLAQKSIKKRELEVNHHRKEFNFKKVCEQKRIHFSESLKMYEQYENIFHANMYVDKSMAEMLKHAHKSGKTVVAITNFYVLPQIKKLEILELSQYIDFLVTSEEFEAEKPDQVLFDYAMELANNPLKSEIIMFGDSLADNTAHLGIDYYPYNCTKLMISISGKSGAGKSTISSVLNEVWKCSIIEGDGYHKFERNSKAWEKLTHYNPKSNNLIQLGLDIKNIYHGISNVNIPIYNHCSGKFDSPVSIKHDSLDVVIIDGLHSLYNEVTGDFVKIRIFIDNELADFQKIERDSIHRQKTEDEVKRSITSREEDYSKYIAIQKEFANFLIYVDSNQKYNIIINDELTFKNFQHTDGKLVLTGDYKDLSSVVKTLVLDLKENRYET